MIHEDLSFLSSDGTTTCIGDLWLPEATPLGIVQIIHGMVEHFRCYDHVAKVFTEAGYMVCGIDQLGHGRTTPNPDKRGVFDHLHGASQLIEDQHLLRTLISERYPKLPYIVLGHSMGSFVARGYISRYGQGLAGAVIMGTAWTGIARVSKPFMRVIARFHGWDYRSAFVDSLGAGGYNKRFEGTGAQTGYEWLSSDPARPLAYAADPDCGWMFSISGYYTIANLLDEIQDKAALARIPHELAILILSGEEDPVGNNGKGPKKLFDVLRQAGLNKVELKLYPGARHELHNERNRAQVFADIIAFLNTSTASAKGVR